jgi:L-aminopeptidase/D-esterase-like protein
MQTHSSLGQRIRPIATIEDGDILFTVTTKKGPAKDKVKGFDIYAAAAATLQEAIDNGVRAANPLAAAPRSKR